LITEDTLWLADYFGNTKGMEQAKQDVPYAWQWGQKVHVPIPDTCHWAYECVVHHALPLTGSSLFLAQIQNMQLDSAWQDMGPESIDLTRVQPAIYAPYRYFSIGTALGNMGEWKAHLQP